MSRVNRRFLLTNLLVQIWGITVMRIEQSPITLFWDNSGAIAQSKEPRNHSRDKHIEHKYHLIREIVTRGDVVVGKIP
jgi:hypothetical protein